MATYTNNLNLKKPSTSEHYDVVGDLNDSKDKIDKAIGDHALQLSDKAKSIRDFPIVIPEANDSGRFQRALNSGYNIILEKEVEYTLKNVPIPSGNITIFGNKSKVKTVGPDDSGFIISATAKNIRVYDLLFEGVADGSNPTPAGINILSNGVSYSRGTSAKNIEIAGCDFRGFVFGVIATGVTGLKIHNCTGGGHKYVQSANAGGYFILVQTCYDVDIYDNNAVATLTDRHAVYISCDPSKLGDLRNENVNIYNNTFDWTQTGNAGGFECIIQARSTKNLHIFANKTKGGYGGILITPSHGDMLNVDIHDNQVIDGLTNGVNDFYSIAAAPQDNNGSYKIRNLKIHSNHILSSVSQASGYGIYDVIGFEIYNNSGIVEGTGSRGLQVAKCSEGLIHGNRFKSGDVQARVGIGLGDNDNIAIYGNKTTGFWLGKEEIYANAVISNISHPEKRSAYISGNGSSITITKQNDDDFIESVAGDPYGCVITFKKNVTVRSGMVSITPMDGNPIRYFYNRSINATNRTLTLGIKSIDGVIDYNLASITCNFEVVINE